MPNQHPLREPSSVPRTEARRLVAGGGRYIDDFELPGMLHAAFVRSDVARAKLISVDLSAAQEMPGVVAAFVAADFAPYIAKIPRTTVANVPGHRSPEQPPLASGQVRYQGEPVALVIAESQSSAEDAAAAARVDYDEQPAVSSLEAALAPNAPIIGETGNIAFEANFGTEFAIPADAVRLEARFSFGRQTGVALEPRGIVAQFDRFDEQLTIHQSHQAPHLVQAVLAELLGLPHANVRVAVGDVGGGFGVKLHIYPDELATVVAARVLGRPIKYRLSRSESFVSDCQAREFEATGAITVSREGHVVGMEGDFSNAIGAYSIYPRASIGDAALSGRLLGTPYRMAGVKATSRSIWQNKPPAGAIRGVSQPILCTVTEHLMDMAARHLGEDPAAFRRRHYRAIDDYPTATPTGLYMERLSFVECLDRLLAVMSYDALRAEQRRLRDAKILRGIGIASFVELTAPGAGLYGPAGTPVTAIDECRIRLEADGGVRVETGATDQGQGTLTGVRQVVAGILGVALDSVRVTTSDSSGARGSGAWASRGLSMAGEAAALASADLKKHILEAAAALLQRCPGSLSIENGFISSIDGAGMSLEALAKTAWYNPVELPAGISERLALSRSFVLQGRPHLMANGVQAALAEVDPETGVVTLLKHWVVEDCGHLVNPALVDGQIMGGVAQGIGAALMESCHYDQTGQLLNGSFLDYTLPRADNVPEIEVHHISTPQAGTALGIKGVGEAGTIGAPAAVWAAINDAIAPLGASITAQPITSEMVATACAKAISTGSANDPSSRQ